MPEAQFPRSGHGVGSPETAHAVFPERPKGGEKTVKRTNRVIALLVTTALMVAMVAMAGAPSAFGQTFAETGGLTDAHAKTVEAHIGG